MKQDKENFRLTEFFQENALVIANTHFQQHKRRLYIWTLPDGQYQNQIDSILCSQRWRIFIQSAKTRPGADCGSDHELLIAKFRLKLKKVGKITRPFSEWSESHSVFSDSLQPHGLVQARILEWVAITFSRGSSQPKDWTQDSCIPGGFFTCWATREAQEYWSG